jgi:hypothetical protein
VVIKTFKSLKRHSTTQKHIPLRACLITQLVDTTACFDGATQTGGKQRGAGGVIKTPNLSVYRWFFN